MARAWNTVADEFRKETKLTQKEKTLARNAFTIFVCAILLSSFAVPAFADVSFDDATNISSDEDNVSAQIRLAAAGDNVYVVWRNNTANSAEILMRVSTTNGNPGSFGNVINLSDSTGESINPQVNASGTKAYIVWEDDKGGANSDVYFRNSTDNGATLFTEKNLSGSGGTDSVDPQIAISDTNVYVVWQEGTTTPDILFTNSTDDGENFDAGAPFNLSNDAEKSFDPQITASGNNVYVVWYNHTASFSIPKDTIAPDAAILGVGSAGERLAPMTATCTSVLNLLELSVLALNAIVSLGVVNETV